MKRIGVLFLAVCMTCFAVFGSFGLDALSAAAEPSASLQSEDAAAGSQSENNLPTPAPSPAAIDETGPTPTVESDPTPTPTVDAEPTPGATGEAEPTPEPTGEAEPTPEPTGEAEPTPGATGEAEPTPEPTPTGEAEPTPGATEEPAPEPTEAIVRGSGPAWIEIEGGRQYGELNELIPISDGTIYICGKDVLALTGYTVEGLRAISFEPDREIFPSKSDVVIVSDLDPNGNALENTVFLWVGDPSNLPTEPSSPLSELELSQEEPLEMEIQVLTFYNPGGLPTYALTSVPALSEGQTFAVLWDDGAPAAIQGDRYTPEGPCTLRFAVVDEGGNVLAKSARQVAEIAPEEMGGEDEAQAASGAPATVRSFMAAAPTTELPNDPSPEATEAAIEEEEMEEKVDAPPTTTVSTEIEIRVSAFDYFPGEVSDIAPTFILSGLPATGDYRYAAMINGGDPVAIDGNTYTATQDGSYTLRFAIIDPNGNIAALSAKYSLELNFAASVSRKQAWMAGPDGSRQYGTLAGLITRASSGTTIYLSVSGVIPLNLSASALSGIHLKPDPDVFPGSYTVKVSNVHPETGENGKLYVWAADVSGSGGSLDEVELYVASENHRPGEWTSEYPAFVLVKVPDTAAGYDYAVIVDDGTPVLLSSGVFTANMEGRYSLRFALIDDTGRIAAESAKYEVAVDTAAPVLRVEAGENLVLTATVSDALSESIQISFDAGATWQEATALEDGSLGAVYTGTMGQVFAPGTILARDAAGNIAAYDQEITLSGSGGFFGGGFGGAGGGGSSRTVSHSSADDSSTTAYNAVELSLEETEMSYLTLGGEELDLSISRVSPDGSGAEPALFTAELAAWNETEEGVYDSLVLSAVTEGGECAYQWAFNGAVYKKLSASGIDYLILRVGNRLTAISTAGFTAGNRYNLLKSSGVSSKAFKYSVVMGVPQPVLEMEVTVEGERFPLSDDRSEEMYYYDVYPGGPEMLNRTFGA